MSWGLFQELGRRRVGPTFGQADDLPGHSVELVAVAEVFPQPGTNPQAVFRIDAEVSAVEQRVDIRSKEQAIVEAVLAASGDRADVRSLQDWRDMRSAYRAASMISVEDDRLERTLT